MWADFVNGPWHGKRCVVPDGTTRWAVHKPMRRSIMPEPISARAPDDQVEYRLKYYDPESNHGLFAPAWEKPDVTPRALMPWAVFVALTAPCPSD